MRAKATLSNSDSDIKSMSEKVISTANPIENQDLTLHYHGASLLKLAPSGSLQPLHHVNTGDAGINHALKCHCFKAWLSFSQCLCYHSQKKETLWLFFFEQGL